MVATLSRILFIFVGVPVGLALLFGAPLWPLLLGYAGWAAAMWWGAQEGVRPPKAVKSHASSIAFLLVLVLVLPVAFASVMRPSWQAILIAYAIWFGLLGFWAVQGLRSRGVGTGEALGWPMIFAMFLTMLVVPVLTLLLTITGAA